jgi:hypothetical protein
LILSIPGEGAEELEVLLKVVPLLLAIALLKFQDALGDNFAYCCTQLDYFWIVTKTLLFRTDAEDSHRLVKGVGCQRPNPVACRLVDAIEHDVEEVLTVVRKIRPLDKLQDNRWFLGRREVDV